MAADQPRRRTLVRLWVLAALALLLAAGYAGQDKDWLIILLYVTVSGTATFNRPRRVLGWLGLWITVIIGKTRTRNRIEAVHKAQSHGWPRRTRAVCATVTG